MTSEWFREMVCATVVFLIRPLAFQRWNFCVHLREKKKRYRWYLDEWNPKRPCTLRDSKMQVEGMSASGVIVRTRIGGEYELDN